MTSPDALGDLRDALARLRSLYRDSDPVNGLLDEIDVAVLRVEEDLEAVTDEISLADAVAFAERRAGWDPNP